MHLAWKTFLLALIPTLTLVACSFSGDDDDRPATDERSTEDRPDEVDGPQIHLVYVLPSDAEDRELDTNRTIAASFLVAEEWLSQQTDGRTLRLDTFGGEPDVSFFRLDRDDVTMKAEGAFVRDEVEGDLHDAGFDAGDKLYVAYYEGGSTAACGAGAYPPTLPGNTAILYLYGEPLNGAIQCADYVFAAEGEPPSNWEFIAVHELLHTLGFVPDCAPHEELFGHISGPFNDLMYDGDEETDEPRALDPGNDDYFRTDIEDCLDFEDSGYLTR